MGLFSRFFGSNNDDDHGQSWEPENWQAPEEDSQEDSQEDIDWITPLADKRDREMAQATNEFEKGRAAARFEIDDMRRYYSQYGYRSFSEAMTVAGKHAHSLYLSNRNLVAQGYTELQDKAEFDRGRLSLFD